MVNFTDIANWLYPNLWWYLPLHVATGVIGRGWYEYCCDQELHEKFNRPLQELGCTLEDLEDIKKLDSPQMVLFGVLFVLLKILTLVLGILAGPLMLVATLILGAVGIIKLRRGLKFSL